jgi:hypothetical protein
LKTTALTTLHELAVLPHLTIPTNLVDRRNQTLLTSQSPGETTSKASACMSIPGLDTYGITAELLPKQ